MTRKFVHFGMVTKDKNFPGLNYNEILDCYCSDPAADPNTVEWLYFPETCPLSKTPLATGGHIAYVVDDLAAAVEGKDCIVPPTEVAPGIKIAFFIEDGALTEYCQVG